MLPAEILHHYNIDCSKISIVPLKSGLINTTWKLTSNSNEYILQRINTNVFKCPENIASNIENVAAYLQQHCPDYLFIRPLATKNNDVMVIAEIGCFRLFPFVPQSHTIDVVTTPQQAYEAARQFGAFTKCLEHFSLSDLKTTLPDFHNLSLRYQQFEVAMQNGNAERMKEAKKEIGILQSYKKIVTEFEHLKLNADFKQRVTHHDTKISNVLFDANNKGLCVIDLDTVMPGYFISDVGDMLRTYISPANEGETNFSRIQLRQEYIAAIEAGYMSEMGTVLSAAEKNAFIYAGKFMLYMQAIRFLTDYLNNDIYYGSNYKQHNLMRAKNQMELLQQLINAYS
jgi:Ser/Thr protein kinase RdoA (MazF antagonist)